MTREQLHVLLDELPAEALAPAGRLLKSLRDRSLANAYVSLLGWLGPEATELTDAALLLLKKRMKIHKVSVRDIAKELNAKGADDVSGADLESLLRGGFFSIYDYMGVSLAVRKKRDPKTATLVDAGKAVGVAGPLPKDNIVMEAARSEAGKIRTESDYNVFVEDGSKPEQAKPLDAFFTVLTEWMKDVYEELDPKNTESLALRFVSLDSDTSVQGSSGSDQS